MKISGYPISLSSGSFCSFVIVALLFGGCATPVDPNPSAPTANTGYVDFYCESASDLSWDVLLLDSKSGKFKPGFSEYKPFPGNVLRVPAPPGKHRFQVGIFNKVNDGPEQIDVDVALGKVTPVKVTLEHTGRITTERKVYGFRGSVKGYARGTKIVSAENDVVDILLESENPQPYALKERMRYFKAPPK